MLHGPHNKFYELWIIKTRSTSARLDKHSDKLQPMNTNLTLLTLGYVLFLLHLQHTEVQYCRYKALWWIRNDGKLLQ